uniref:MULE transposase domain-containing protein n=1 Tax=Ditylenchus dipsaci TaxID=166011 RepID=A0A915E945_9BILA
MVSVFPEAAKNYTFAKNDPELFLLGDEFDQSGNRLLLFGRTSNKNWSGNMKMAVISALEVVFPESEVWGCFFHLVQNMIKKLNSAGLKDATRRNQILLMITAMAFVKPEDVMPVFAELEELLPEELDPILDWFQKYYIGFVNRRGNMVVPMFAHSLWNVYERTLNGNHRTNNYAEAANHRIQMDRGAIKNICNGKLESVQREADRLQRSGRSHSQNRGGI